MFLEFKLPIWAVIVFSVFTSVCFIYLLAGLAEKVGLIDEPSGRKVHASSVPTIGGLAIYLVGCSALLVLDPPEKIDWLALSISMLVAIGVLDDAFELGIRLRLIFQVVATSVMIWGSNLLVQNVGFEPFGISELPQVAWLAFTVIAVVGLTNGFNMIDGIDGLAAGQTLISIASIATTLLVLHASVYKFEWLALLLSSVFVFSLINLSLTPLKPVFLGDAGSLLLGFVVSWSLIYYSQEPVALIHPVAALWCVMVPVADTLLVIFRRILSSHSPFIADRRHLHYTLMDAGLGSRQTLIAILCISCLANTSGILITYLISPAVGLVVFCLATVVLGYAAQITSLVRRSNSES